MSGCNKNKIWSAQLLRLLNDPSGAQSNVSLDLCVCVCFILAKAIFIRLQRMFFFSSHIYRSIFAQPSVIVIDWTSLYFFSCVPQNGSKTRKTSQTVKQLKYKQQQHICYNCQQTTYNMICLAHCMHTPLKECFVCDLRSFSHSLFALLWNLVYVFSVLL